MLPNRSGDIEMYEEMVWNRGGRALVEYTPLPSVARFGEKLPFWLNFKSLEFLKFIYYLCEILTYFGIFFLFVSFYCCKSANNLAIWSHCLHHVEIRGLGYILLPILTSFSIR